VAGGIQLKSTPIRTATYGLFFETTHGKSRIYDDRVGVSVSLSVREHISVTTRLIFTNFYACYLWPWLDSPLEALRHVIYFWFYG